MLWSHRELLALPSSLSAAGKCQETNDKSVREAYAYTIVPSTCVEAENKEAAPWNNIEDGKDVVKRNGNAYAYKKAPSTGEDDDEAAPLNDSEDREYDEWQKNGQRRKRRSSHYDQLKVRQSQILASIAEEQLQQSSFLVPGSCAAAVLNLASATMGLGSLSLPLAVSEAGMVVTSLACLGMFCTDFFSIYCIATCLDVAEVGSMEEVAISLGGQALGAFVEFCNCVFCFGTMVGILLGAARLVQIILPDASMPIITAVISVVVIPPLLSESVSSLSSLSLFSQFCIYYTSAVIVAEVFLLGVHDTVLEPASVAPETDLLWNRGTWNLDLLIYGRAGMRGDKLGYVKAISIFIFAFANQTVIPCIYLELRERNVWAMTRIGCVGLSIVTLLYSAVAFCGFLTWGETCESSVVFNYRKYMVLDHPKMLVMLGSCLVSAAACYPINAFPLKNSVSAMLGVATPARWTSLTGHFAVLVLVSGAYVVGDILPSLSIVLELVGATAGVSVMFFIPAGFYLARVPHERSHCCARCLCFIVLLMGCVVFACGVWSSMRDIMHHGQITTPSLRNESVMAMLPQTELEAEEEEQGFSHPT